MVRWEPGARERLRTAAMDLYVRRGFEKTTAADIAQAAGLTERTFFRHFTDKREVIFAGQEMFEKVFLDGVAAAAPEASTLETVESALDAAAGFFLEEHRPFSRVRHTIISANPALQERELLKMASLATAIAVALMGRGVPESTGRLAAESTVTVFSVTFQKWIAEGEERSFPELQREVLAELVGMISASARLGG